MGHSYHVSELCVEQGVPQRLNRPFTPVLKLLIGFLIPVIMCLSMCEEH